MENEDNRVGRDTETSRYGGIRGNGQHVPCAIGHSIRPGVPCPETVLVAVMSDGSHLLLDYPQGEPAALVVGEDADLLRQALEGAFGNPTDEVASENGNSNETMVAGNGALGTEKVQP